MNKFVKLLFFAGVILFCWGWISNVALGRMTTGQYVRKIGTDFQQGISDKLEKLRKITDRIARNSDTFYGSVI